MSNASSDPFRRECLDRVIIVTAAGLRHVLSAYVEYDTASRTHLALEKDAPVPVNNSVLLATIDLAGLRR